MGNSIKPQKQIQVLGLDDAVPPDYWKSSVSCSPKAVDRQLGTFINQRVYCQVSLEKKSAAEPKILSITDASCTGSKSVETFSTFNKESGSTSPVIKFVLKKDELRLDSDDFKCSFNVVSRVGDKVTKNPEIENIDISIKFYNNPLGEISEEVQNKIDDAKKDIDGIWKKIGTWNKIITYAKKICQFINVIYLAASAIYTAAIALKIIGTATPPPFDAVPQAAATATCYSSENTNNWADRFKGTTDRFCDYVTCKQTILWGSAAKEWINSAPLAGYIGPKKDGEGSYYDPLNDRFYGTRPLSEYMDPRNNLMTATLFACIPGIITGLEKYRQIKCLYADCLQTAVAQDGLPVTACEDMKKYATCKYIAGEVFAVIPYTAFFDHFTGIVKDSLSNPFTALGVVASLYCGGGCPPEKDGGAKYAACRGIRVFSLLGDTVENVRNLVNEGFKVRQDYCTRLDSQEESGEESGEEE